MTSSLSWLVPDELTTRTTRPGAAASWDDPKGMGAGRDRRPAHNFLGQNPPVPFGVPRPVGPSQPTRAVHNCDGEQVPLLPETMSKNDPEWAYG